VLDGVLNPSGEGLIWWGERSYPAIHTVENLHLQAAAATGQKRKWFCLITDDFCCLLKLKCYIYGATAIKVLLFSVQCFTWFHESNGLRRSPLKWSI